MEAASKSNIKKVTLELGGKGANIVFADADINEAVKYAAHGIFFNHGQTCVRFSSRFAFLDADENQCAGSRLFVQRSIYDEFATKFAQVASKIRVGYVCLGLPRIVGGGS
jgi:aldehyde dehydrogenase (NAD+)